MKKKKKNSGEGTAGIVVGEDGYIPLLLNLQNNEGFKKVAGCSSQRACDKKAIFLARKMSQEDNFVLVIFV